MAIISGHGATLVFGTSTGFTPKYTSIGGFDLSRETLDTTYLSTAGARTYVPGDIWAIGPFTSSFFFEPAETATSEDCSFLDLLFDTGTTKAAAAETVTVTYNDPTANTQSVSGSAFVTGAAIEDLATDTLLMASVTIQWATWPTFTDAGA